ncbi:hypothetical protein IMZ31_23620 (plasmid) [Pontibacillus sp. ALD_SL1]|uniref:hypothetical protein n=1 Tax=Pontibacillus sp. ALD_SL1 TaxID=2777185 RepID=UPI001A95C0C4|nr:hypothetical protein [Pontibacillus sp. ALD_SL1]QST02441.1 hypothetical protein IMZ31_23620 [Pontibacillus sp. ALD_SL1]
MGERVLITNGMHRGEIGTIKGEERLFKETEGEGFAEDGLVTLESSIESISVPYEFDGEVLRIHMEEQDYGDWIKKAHTKTSRYWKMGYIVKIDENSHLTLISEDQLKILD